MASRASSWARLLLAFLLASCSRAPQPGPPADRWSQVRSFACQLQKLDPARPPRTDLLITDPTRDGSRALTTAEISQLRTGSPLLLGYLSLGEAENYRSYWKKDWRPGHPGWLGPTNPDWGGNYKVRYWDPEWRRLILKNADVVLSQGFDGLFLDVVDGWEYWQPRHPQARDQMVELVTELAAHTRQQRADFGIFLNGGEGLLHNPQLLRTITGVVKEEIFFGLNGDGLPTPAAFTRDCQSRLKPALEAGKLVLSIDYTNDPKQKRQAHESAQKAGYLEFIGARQLDQIPPDP